MLRKIKISTKITLIILIISFVAVTAISFFTYDYNLKANQEKYLNNLNVTADAKAEYLDTYFEKAFAGIKIIQNSPVVTGEETTSEIVTGEEISSETFGNDESLSEPAEEDLGFDLDEDSDDGSLSGLGDMGFSSIPENESSKTENLNEFLQQQKKSFDFNEVYILSTTGHILHSTDDANKAGKNFSAPNEVIFQKGQNGIHVGPVKKEGKIYKTFIAAPLETGKGKQLLLVTLNLTKPYQTLKDYKGLGETGEILIVRADSSVINNIKQFYISPLRQDTSDIVQSVKGEVVQLVSKTTSEGPLSVEGIDYRGVETFQVTRLIPASQWVLIAKMDTLEAAGNSKSIINTFIFASVGVLALALLLSMIFARSVTAPLHNMRNTIGMVAQGILPEKSEDHSTDEFGQMATRVDELVQTLKENADFAKSVGEGKYNTEFKPVSENDVLGMSLINMRKNLIENERRDKERNWIVRGVAEISEILRLHDTLDTLGNDVIKFIIEKIGAIQGAFYAVNDDYEGDRFIELRASYAYGRKKYLQKQFKFAEGLVGQAGIERDTILRTEIPEDYVTITSGILGEQRPTCILIVPLITNEEVFGVLEFAGLKKFDSSQVKFVQELSLILARTIFNIRVNERTRKLLAESQEMSTELKIKQEVLSQNAEEMQATQEELRRSNQRLEEQIEEVNNTQKRMQLLLENASEVITIYEQNESIRYISPSVETILGYVQNELIGKTDKEHVHADHQELYADIFKRMLEHPDEKVTVQYQYQTKEGNYIWIESTGTNCMSNPAIHGFILNSRDITEKRRAEQEQRMRSKMQALSENSPDLITRLENESISYINPIIESYTGKTPASFLNKNVKQTELDTVILEKWLSIVEQVNTTNSTVATEMDFPSEMGHRVMQVNAIPEYDETNQLESVLVVSHDITERKMIELEIQNKNKKITESINYAKRIQNAILPNNRVINKALPDSFILYKPRDVVSGDFPWYVQIKEDIFIAAVDCTGHGVPGALLSLIGYFLLNDIVRSRRVTEPGKILDLLDEGVTSTLRQDEDATTKDGMDIALCKINLNNREVEYAGAHRPMYIIKGGEMEEIKGNKFPIGGGIFKNQTNFTNHKLKLSKNDSIYFSSDGFPDQFGGPEGRKFGPKRVREIITTIHEKPMKEAMQIFDHEWETWRDDTKQTDDVLLIGIKF